MEVRTDSKNGASVASPSDTIKAFEVQTQGCKEQWIQQLRDNPDRFADIEQQIDQHYRLGGGQLLASVLAEVSKDPQMDEHIQKTCRDTAKPLRSPEPRSLKVRLVCGNSSSVEKDHRSVRRSVRRMQGVQKRRYPQPLGDARASPLSKAQQ